MIPQMELVLTDRRRIVRLDQVLWHEQFRCCLQLQIQVFSKDDSKFTPIRQLFKKREYQTVYFIEECSSYRWRSILSWGGNACGQKIPFVVINLNMEVLVEQHGVELLKDNAQAVMFSVNPSISWRRVDLPSSTCP